MLVLNDFAVLKIEATSYLISYVFISSVVFSIVSIAHIIFSVGILFDAVVKLNPFDSTDITGLSSVTL